MLSKNLVLKNRIIQIIDKALNHETSFLSLMIEDNEKETLEMKGEILSYIKQGILGK